MQEHSDTSLSTDQLNISAIASSLKAQGAHDAFIEQRLPAWLLDASVEQRQQLRDAIVRSQRSKLEVRKALAGWQGVRAFAEPLLADALKREFGLTPDLEHSTFVHLIRGSRAVVNTPGPVLKTFKPSLLQAALQNFIADETFDIGTELRHGSDVLAIGAPAFARVCRELDLGRRYQEHLTTIFEPGAASGQGGDAARNLRESTMRCQRDALEVQASLALLQGHIGQQAHDGLLAGLKNRLGAVFKAYRLSLWGLALDEVLLFEVQTADENGIAPCLVYIPDDANGALRHYPSRSAFMQALRECLQARTYQAYFGRFVGQRNRGAYLQKVEKSFNTLRLGPDRSFESVDISTVRLDLEAHQVEGDLFHSCFNQHLARIRDDARVLAVPTADIDANQRLARLEQWLEVGLNVLNAAAFFVPVLGLLMIPVAGAQLLGAFFHGVEAWEEGETEQAADYLMGVVLNVALIVAIGKLHGGQKPILPPEGVGFSDSLERIRLPDGQQRLWKPDMTPYAHDLELAPDTLNAHGQYVVEGKHYIRLHGKIFEQVYNRDLKQWQIKHPTDPAAHQPLLVHNGQGAWRLEHENPLSWDRATLLRRIGHSVDGFSDAELEQAAQISDTSDQALRAMHVEQQALPSSLADTLERVKALGEMERVIRSARNGERVDAHSAFAPSVAPSLAGWPPGRNLEVFKGPDFAGEKVGTYEAGGASTNRPVKVLYSDLISGRFAEAILEQLDTREINAMLGDSIPVTERASTLRHLLAQRLDANREGIFESIYNGAQAADDRVQAVRQHFPRLDEPLARRLIERLPEQERSAWSSPSELPERLRTLAAEASADVVMDRVFEGLHYPDIAQADTDRLILASLTRLDGWSREMGLELSEGSPYGPVLGRAGRIGAPIKRVIVKSDAGYRAFEGDNALHSLTPARQDNTMYKALLHALPDAQRDALKLRLYDHDPLRSLVLEVANKNREQAARWLFGAEVHSKWPESGRLAGGGGSLGRMLSYLPAPLSEPYAHRQFRTLFPGLSDVAREAEFALWRGAGIAPIDRLNELTEEFRKLEADLAGWAGTSWRRARISEQIRKAWQQVTLFDAELEIPMLDLADRGLTDRDFADFPRLEASFDHVPCIDLSGNELTQWPDSLLIRFKGVYRLLAPGNDLSEMPLVVDPQVLTTLDLRRNSISLTPSEQNWLASCTELSTLSLSGNPLVRAPDLTALSRLHTVQLAGCGLTQLPDGLAGLRLLKRAELLRNAIEALPEHLSELPVGIGRALDLGENPLNDQARGLVDAYYTAHGIDLEEVVGKNPLDFAEGPSLQRWDNLRQAGSRTFFRELASQSETVTFRVAGHTMRRRIDEVLVWLEGSQAARDEVFGLRKPAFTDVEQRMRVARIFSAVPAAQQGARLLALVTGFVRVPYINEWLGLLYEDYVLPQAYPHTHEVIVQAALSALSVEPRLWLPEAPRLDEEVNIELAAPTAVDVMEEHIGGLVNDALAFDAGSPEGLEQITGNDYWVRYLKTLSTRFAELEQENDDLEDQVEIEDPDENDNSNQPSQNNGKERISENDYMNKLNENMEEYTALKQSLTRHIYQQMQGQG